VQLLRHRAAAIEGRDERIKTRALSSATNVQSRRDRRNPPGRRTETADHVSAPARVAMATAECNLHRPAL